MVDTAKEAYGHLEKAVELIKDDWDKNQAIDALNYLKENLFDKGMINESVIAIEGSVKEIKTELGMKLTFLTQFMLWNTTTIR